MSYDPVKAADKGDYYAEEQVPAQNSDQQKDYLDVVSTKFCLRCEGLLNVPICRCTRRPGTWGSSRPWASSSPLPTSASASGSG